MKFSAKYLLAVLILGALAVPTPVPSVPAVPAGPEFAGMPLVFAANAGQIDDRASYYVAGKVKASYPASYQNAARGNWSYESKRTGDFHFVAALLFERDDFGNDVMHPEQHGHVQPQQPPAAPGA